MTPGNETTTQHDRKPTHPNVPAILAQLRRKKETAWAAYFAAVDAWEDGFGDIDIAPALEVAEAADRAYIVACNDPATWMPDEACTCTTAEAAGHGATQPCPVCAAETQGDEIPY